jgi:competence protein CoiA
LQIQKILTPGEIQMERPLPTINRVADLLWERKKLVFEIQCSSIYEGEAASRIKEYRNAGYEIAWILDDRIFNKRRLRPAEKFLRSHLAYFASLQRSSPSYIYDQFEIFHDEQRIKKGREMRINLQHLHPLPPIQWPAELPSQIENRIPNSRWYCEKDLIHRTLLSRRYPSYRLSLQNWRSLEIQLKKARRRPSWLHRFFVHFIRNPYLALLDELLKRVN